MNDFKITYYSLTILCVKKNRVIPIILAGKAKVVFSQGRKFFFGNDFSLHMFHGKSWLNFFNYYFRFTGCGQWEVPLLMIATVRKSIWIILGPWPNNNFGLDLMSIQFSDSHTVRDVTRHHKDQKNNSTRHFTWLPSYFYEY